MAETTKAPTENKGTQLEAGTYEIIRNRLHQQATELKTRLDQLNTARKTVFGAIETKLIANDRINTNNYCIARDILAIGQYCLFGYNVHIGLRSGIQLKDVFSIYTFTDNRFQEADLNLLKNEKFETDFQNLYRYYKDAFFARFYQKGAYLYMVFQISANPGDIKAFKWLIKEDKLVYIDARSDHEVSLPDQHEFRWQRATRDMQRMGRHPHISILDRIFVETVGGDLTIKVEDNTDDGLGIFREEVEYKDQTLDDAEYFFADLGNLIALKVRPYQEKPRHFVYNEKLQQVQRIEALGDSGILLPDGHGLIFPNGYYLQTGEFKIFDPDLRNKRFINRVSSPNGEDYLYIFNNLAKGTYVLLHYNLIEQKVNTPIICHGFTLFPNGELAYFRAEEEPTKHHLIQLWQTPFVAGEQVPSEHTDSYLYKIGNKDVVRAMAEANEVLILSDKDDSYAGLYSDLAKKCTEILDSYYWIDKKETYQLHEPLLEIRATASTAIEEYEKKLSIQRNSEARMEQVRTQAIDLFDKVRRQSFDSIELFVDSLSSLRQLRGEIISLRDLRYNDPALVDQLEEEASKRSSELSEQCVRFLLEEESLAPYLQKIETQRAAIEAITTATEAESQEEEIDATGEGLQLLIDIVSNLKIEDATQTTRIIDNISAMYASLNQVKAAVKRKRQSLMSTEAKAEFNAQLKLLDQGMINFLDLANTPDKCDEYLTKLMVQVEELEGRFTVFDEFIEKLTEKREAIYNAFEERKKQLIEALNNRTASLQAAAERILNGVKTRIRNFKEVSEINAFFAADLMIDKVRDIIQQLLDLNDSNKANGLQAQLKALKEEGIRQLRDRQDLYVDGENVIRFGKHVFPVNVQPLDLTVVQREGQLFYHLTGTDFFEPIQDERLDTTKSIWNQPLVSENENVYRSEFLAYQLFKEGIGKDIDKAELGEETLVPALLDAVRKAAATRFNEGYAKGIHDEDAARILQALLFINADIDLLAFSPNVRAFAHLVWERFIDTESKALLDKQLQSAKNILEVFPNTHEFDYLIEEIKKVVRRAADQI